jgi:hypothetical protein
MVSAHIPGLQRRPCWPPIGTRTVSSSTDRPRRSPTRHAHGNPGSTDAATDTHDRVRRDKINKAGTVTLRVAGQPRHIGVGRTYVLLLVQDLNVRVIDAAGELLRDLIIDPRRGLPAHRTTPRTDPRKRPTDLRNAGPLSPMS